MFKKPNYKCVAIKAGISYEAESIEKYLQKVVENKEPIESAAPMLYTPREEGVLPQYDIRTDRWDLALEATDKISKSLNAKREDSTKTTDKKTEPEPPAEPKAA